MEVKARDVFEFKRSRIYSGVLVCVVFSCLGLWFVVEPERFIRNVFQTGEHIRLLGFVVCVLFMLTLFAMVMLLFRDKEAVVILEEYIIDRSKFEAIGKIYFREIKEIKRFKKDCIELVLNVSVFKTRNLTVLQKFLLYAYNWNPRNTVLISCALLSCDRETALVNYSGQPKC